MVAARELLEGSEILPGHSLSSEALTVGPWGLQMVIKISVDSGAVTKLTENNSDIHVPIRAEHSTVPSSMHFDHL